MKKILLPFLGLALLAPNWLGAQRVCGSAEHYQHMLNNDPNFAKNHEEIEKHTTEFEAKGDKKTRAVVTIPVVFHIVYNTAAQNVSDAQIASQMTVLNNDYRKLNADLSNIPAAFQSLVADCEVQFCMAAQDPNGNPTTGIVRKSTSTTSFSTNDAMKKTATGGDDAWNSAKYLNIWVCNLSGGVLGYAQFPGGAAATDGVVITYTGFGTIGTAAAPFNKGRTATHEVGHWLNLFHIWGDDGTSCTGSDLVNDTPNQADENYGCPTFPAVSCSNGPNGDLFMNYMDYTDDACMYMFTTGQKARMTALFAAGGARNGLTTSMGCQTPTPLACGNVSGLTASAITTTSATVSWTAVSGALSYDVQYKLSSATTWTTVTATTNSRALTGLTAGSVYNYQVRAICTAGAGNYSAASSFTTTSSGGGSCSNNYESNNTRNTAATISANTNITSMIGTSTDKDYFKFTTTAAAPKVRVTLSNLPFDYDMKLYNSAGTLLATSANGSTTSEVIKYNSSSVGATYTVYVYGYSGAFSSTQCYTLNASTSATNWRLDGSENSSSKPELSIYPNPVSDKVSVQFYADANMSTTINVFNALGQKVVNQQMTTVQGENNAQFELQHLSNGIYIMEVIAGDERKIQKFTIQK